MGNVKRVSFLYVNGDKKRKEFNNVKVIFDQGCMVVYNVQFQEEGTLYVFPLSTITNIKIVPPKEEEA